jgi:hypothetical protein
MHRGPRDQTGGEPFPLVADAWAGGSPAWQVRSQLRARCTTASSLPGERYVDRGVRPGAATLNL